MIHACNCRKHFSLIFFAFCLLVLCRKSLHKVLWHFWSFSRIYKVAKFWIIKLYLNVSEVVHVNEHKKHNCGLHGNFWRFLLMLFCFMKKKIILSKSCYFGLRFPLTYFILFSVTSILKLQQWTEVTSFINLKCVEAKSYKWLKKTKWINAKIQKFFFFFFFFCVRDSQNNFASCF